MATDPPRRKDRLRLNIEALEGRALLAGAGTLDPAFAAGGTIGYPLDVPVLPDFNAQATALVTLPESGEFLAIGTVSIDEGSEVAQPADQGTTESMSELVITRLDGRLVPEPAFGEDGRVQLPIANGQSFQVAVQPDGKILLASAANAGLADATYLVARLDADGSLDPTFGADGVAEYPGPLATPQADRISQIASVLVEPDGQILLAGSSVAGFSSVRLNADGSLDPSYGQGGTATVPVTSGMEATDIGSGAILQASGQLVLTGNVEDVAGLPVDYIDTAEAVAIRWNADGSLDPTFGGSTANGVVVLPPDPSSSPKFGVNLSTSIALQPTTGDILVAGNNQFMSGFSPGSTATLYRLDADGTLDTSFGSGGLITPALTNEVDTPIGLAVQAEGDILLSTNVSNFYPGPNRTNLELLRLGPDGTPDPTFGNNSTPGLFLSNLNASETPGPTIFESDGDILLEGIGTESPSSAVISPADGLTYGLTVEGVLSQATTGPAALASPTPTADLTGLGYSDLAVYDSTTGSFVYQSAIPTTNTDSVPGYNNFAFGLKGSDETIPAVDDYQGLGYDQFAAYLPDSGVYAILPTATSPGLFLPFGMAGYGNSIPVPADYEGTGKADVAVYMPSIASFAILPSDGASGRIVPFGVAGAGQSIPAPADYYQTGQDDIAVYLTHIGAFAIQDPTGKTTGEVIPFGKPGVDQSIPVPGDYDGSGKTELAVYVPSVGAYFYRPANGGPDVEVPIGKANSGEIPVPGDYDGSGRTEAAIYDPADGFIEYQPAFGGTDVTINLVSAADAPGSIPVATAALDQDLYQPIFRPGGIDQGPALQAESIAPANSTSAVGSTSVPAATQTPAMPKVPDPGSARLALSPVNQAAMKPSGGTS
jgi:uncharacterized delta-60 repeat protein